MNYQKIHDHIIDRARGREYDSKKHHNHHIIPIHEDRKSTEVVPLTFKEHAVVHLLRSKFSRYFGPNRYAYLLLRWNEKRTNAWWDWFSSRTLEYKQRESERKSRALKKRIAGIPKEVFSIEIRRRRLFLSPEKKKLRAEKCAANYADGKHDHIFRRYSIERMGAGNPNAKSVTFDGIKYSSVREASRALGISDHILYRRKWKECLA